MKNKFSTGFPGIDTVIDSLRMGDNVVWQVDELEDYVYYARQLVQSACQEGRQVTYFRFGAHEDIFVNNRDINRSIVDPYEGFESFAAAIHRVIEENGTGAIYIFDSLSDLLTVWATDLMIANFFYITCPYLYELDTIAYFAILRGRHSYKTVGKIRETTQVLLDLYKCQETHYLHPIKVWERFSPTMFLPHYRKEEKFIPLKSSFETTQLFTHICHIPADSSNRALDYWDKMFLHTEELSTEKSAVKEQEQLQDQIIRVMITKEPQMAEIVRSYFTLQDLIRIKSRLIGTGYIGGKSTGMLLARQILSADKSENWSNILEPHDSYYIGSDVFYTFIVQNNWWKEWIQHKSGEDYFSGAAFLRESFLKGHFPEEIRGKFMDMLEYFGQSPIIVRSSSLLEDGFGNAFAGKYESYFCPNQGTPEERYQNFIEAVRKIYASTMNDDALEYRMRRGLSDKEEQMSLLIQRVSGSYKNSYFFPDAAGVGVSYNTFAWSKEINPNAGMLRIVAGMGTRAVNRVEGDYPAVIALDQPQISPYPESSGEIEFSQQYVDGINMQTNRFETFSLSRLMSENIFKNNTLLMQKDWRLTRRLSELGINKEVHRINFQGLIENTNFCRVMSNLLSSLQNIYQYPVDIEYTLNIESKDKYLINLVQCRPLQTKTAGKKIHLPPNISRKNILLSSTGNFMGGNIQKQISWIVYVVPVEYISLPEEKKYHLARLIGKVNKALKENTNQTIFLAGPGRWGSTTPAMGVPIHFREIQYISILAEVSFRSGNLIPELSFGSHFFHDLVENNIFYTALFPENENVIWNEQFVLDQKNALFDYFPEEEEYQHVLRVCRCSNNKLNILSDVNSQKVLAYLADINR